MANKIEKGAILTVKDTRAGSGGKGDWCFCKTENNDKITLWADNNDFKCGVGDSIEVLDLKSVSVTTKKVGDKYYSNYNVTAILRNKGASPTANFEDFGDSFDDSDSDFI
jgi:hypothetical protein